MLKQSTTKEEQKRF